MAQTLKDRLDQIRESGVPQRTIVAESMERLTKSHVFEQIGVFEGEGYELVTDDPYFKGPLFSEIVGQNVTNYAHRLVEASGNEVGLGEILFGGKSESSLWWENLETHVIYDPKLQTRHYFLLPTRRLITSPQEVSP